MVGDYVDGFLCRHRRRRIGRPTVRARCEPCTVEAGKGMSLRPEALRLLDDAMSRRQANPDRNIVIEGHT
jgi:hypothetical protein